MSLRVQNASHVWSFRGGSVSALRSASAEFVCGVPHVVCGPSGSGKSTLGLIAAGLVEPTEGAVLLDEADIRNRTPEIAFVFQFPENIYFEDSIRRELEEWPASNGERDLSWFEKLGITLSDVAELHPFHLSAGFGRLVAIAMQLSRNPKLLILDEPTIGLDWNHRRLMMNVIREWLSPERILLVITHDLDVMRELGGQAWVLTNGELAWSGPVQELLSNHDALVMYALDA